MTHASSISEPTPPDGGDTSFPESAPVATAPPMLPMMEGPGRFTGRFAVAYTTLGVIMAGALTGLIVLVIKPGATPTPPWSTWKPASGNSTKVVGEIADHIAHNYRLSENGGQLVAVISGPPQVTSGTSKIAISYVAVRRAPQSNTGIAIYPASKLENFTLCGLGQHCSIATGTPSEERGRLVRREALEVALYTFKFAPSVDSIAAFMPPPPGQTTTQLLFLRKDDLKEQLKQPLSKTLSRTTTPLPSDADTTEASTIDKLTEPHLYTYGLEALQTGGAVLILDPAS